MRETATSLIVLLLSSVAFQLTAQNASSRPLALAHVSVVDVVEGRVLSDRTVTVIGDRISAVGNADAVRVPAGTRTIDARGKFLIPGLWDMHVHWDDADSLPLFLANGVTGMRIMWGQAVHHEWRKSFESGKLLAPRMSIASAIVDGANPVFSGSIVVRNGAEARAAVRMSKSEGADFIKVYSRLSREAYFAIADESSTQGIPFAGHVPDPVTAAEASAAGQRSIEHLDGVLEGASDREVEMRSMLSRGVTRQVMRSVWTTYRETYNPERVRALAEQFKRNGTWMVPTLTVLRSNTFQDADALRNDRRLKYISSEMKAVWKTNTDRYAQRAPEDTDLMQWRWQKYLEVVGILGQAGAPLLAGTDVINPYCLPGFSLHDELTLLVHAGLTPAAALRTATINPAVFLGREADLGTIAQGKIADLVLLDADPLQDIHNTTRIQAVLIGGRLLDIGQLKHFLNDAEARAAKRQAIR